MENLICTFKDYLASLSLINFLQFIKELMVFIAALLAIYAFFIWRRQPVLSKKIEIFERMYISVLKVNDLVLKVYKPLAIHGSFPLDERPLTISKMNTADMRDYILQYREKILRENIIATNSVIENRTLFIKYFPDFKSTIENIISLRNRMVEANILALLDREENDSYIDKEYILLIINSFTNPFEPKFLSYSNEKIREMESYISDFEKCFDKLIRHY